MSVVRARPSVVYRVRCADWTGAARENNGRILFPAFRRMDACPASVSPSVCPTSPPRCAPAVALVACLEARVRETN